MSQLPPPQPGPLPAGEPTDDQPAMTPEPIDVKNLPPVSGTGGMRFVPRVVPTLRPRKVRMGVKLSTKAGPVAAAWSGQRLMRLIEDHAPGAALGEGVEYARAGQTKQLLINPGHVHARVQGRLPNAYPVDVRLPTYDHAQWELVIGAMLAEARPLASLLSGEVPSNVEDLFAPLRLRLFPQEASDLSLSCACADFKGGTLWCKHVCCTLALLAERLSADPFLMFSLRGIAKEDLLERLRQRRAIDLAKSSAGAGGTDRPIPAYLPALPGVSDAAAAPLETTAHGFWAVPAVLGELDLPMATPEVTCALLRRLGPTPFDGAKFPLVGLLATCYDVISTDALRQEQDIAELAPLSVDEPPPGDEPDVQVREDASK